MTTAQTHAARLREMVTRRDVYYSRVTDDDQRSLLAGAEALEQEDHSAMVAAHFARTEEINNQHCARLAEHFTRSEAIYERIARALEPKPKGRWALVQYQKVLHFVPVERLPDFMRWFADAEPGEHTAIVPEWAVPVPPNVVITGWEG